MWLIDKRIWVHKVISSYQCIRVLYTSPLYNIRSQTTIRSFYIPITLYPHINIIYNIISLYIHNIYIYIKIMFPYDVGHVDLGTHRWDRKCRTKVERKQPRPSRHNRLTRTRCGTRCPPWKIGKLPFLCSTNGVQWHTDINGNFRILKWRYCTI